MTIQTSRLVDKHGRVVAATSTDDAGVTTGQDGITKSIDFSGAIRDINTGNAVCSFERTAPFSLSIWCKISSTGSEQRFLVKEDTKGYNFGITEPGRGTTNCLELLLLNAYPTNILCVSGSTVITNSAWHHCVATYNGSSTPAGVKLYVDGVEETMSTIYNTLSSTIVNTAPFYIGSWGSGDKRVAGRLLEAVVFNRVLTATEVSLLFHAGKPIDPVKLNLTSAVLHRWRLGNGDGYPLAYNTNGSAHGWFENLTDSNIVTDAP